MIKKSALLFTASLCLAGIAAKPAAAFDVVLKTDTIVCPTIGQLLPLFKKQVSGKAVVAYIEANGCVMFPEGFQISVLQVGRTWSQVGSNGRVMVGFTPDLMQ